MRVKVNIGTNSLLNEATCNERFNQAQMWLDNEVIKDFNPYVPFRYGELARSAIRHTIIGSGAIVYKTPYAKKVYESNGWNFNTNIHPLATDHWAEPVIANNRTKYRNGVATILGGKANG